MIRSRMSVPAVAAVVVLGAATLPGAAQPAPPQPAAPSESGLALGPSDLHETRTERTLQPGVTLTSITRGHVDPDAFWTVEVANPSPSPDPDAPATALTDADNAEASAEQLRAAGLGPRVEEVISPQLADAGGALGYRVRVGTAATREEATTVLADVRAAGLNGSVLFTGWDGEPDDVAGSTGPWHVEVLTIDPRSFEGSLTAAYGPDLEQRERTTEIAAHAGADIAVNAGFFVFSPAAGAPGDPAGVGVYDGELLSEPVAGRPALVLRDDARRTEVARLSWRGEVASAGASLALDGVNRVPGLIRNCGGTDDDLPTALPLHDVTCTDDDEVVAFDASFGASTPAGPGAEVLVDSRGLVTDVRATRGSAVPPGGRTVQATGDSADALLALAEVGRHLRVRTSLVDGDDRPVPTSRSASVVNGGPELVRDGRIWATPRADGMAPVDDPNFYYGWVHKRHPRTIAGVDREGRTVLATIDGRSEDSLGAGIAEAAALAQSLGLRSAVNLDGGGSTTMVADGVVVNDPSDGSGERAVGDALVVLPGRE